MNKLSVCVAAALLTVMSMGATVGADDRDSVTPVPEPASMTLLGLGLAGLVGYRLYSKRR